MTTPDDVMAGQAIYNRALLAVYDILVLGLACRLVWRYPKANILAAYDRYAGRRHLELGVGTAYFLDKCRFPGGGPELTLVDLNPTTLRVGATRLARYRPTVIQANVLEPLPVPAQRFDSVGMNFLLHCLPGGWPAKGAVFANAAAALGKGGRVFGTTILGRGVATTARARASMRLLNSRGVFHNVDDDLDGLRQQLAHYFPDHQVMVRENVAIFVGTANHP